MKSVSGRVLVASMVLASSPAWSQAPAPGDAARAQVLEIFNRIGGLKASLAESYAMNGRFASNYKEAGFEGPVRLPYATATLGAEGVIDISFNNKADPLLRGKVAKFVPMTSVNFDVIWYCLAPQLPEEIRPTRCR